MTNMNIIIVKGGLKTALKKFDTENEACEYLYRLYQRFVNVGIDLSSQAAARQVFSALKSLTTVFGMGTGGPSS